MKKRSIAAVFLTAAVAFSGLSAVPAQAAQVDFEVWAMCNEVGEKKAAQEQTAAFNAYYEGEYKATLSCKANMGDTIKATKAADLADVFEFDGETLANLVYNKKLLALNGVVSSKTITQQLGSVQKAGKYTDGKTYSVAQFDSGLALYGNKAMLKAAGVSYPTTWDKAWTASEFTTALAKLSAKAKSKKALDIKENYGIGGGWAGYAFTPIVNSAGYQLLTNNKAVGSLDSAPVVNAFKTFASWKKYVDPSADDKAFSNKRVALAWVGHWQYPAFKAALKGDLVVIPLPNFGVGTKSGQGSHAWGISAGSTKKSAAAKYLEYITQDRWVNNVSDQNGAVPANKTSLAKNPNYAKGGDLYLYGQQLAKSCGSAKPTTACVTVPRTISAAWPTINSKFSAAVQEIWNGANAKTALNKAAKAIDADYADNNGYKD